MRVQNQTQIIKLPEQYRTLPIRSETEYFSFSLKTWKTFLMDLSQALLLSWTHVPTNIQQLCQRNNHSLESIVIIYVK